MSKWKLLIPRFRRAAERDMQEELASLAAIAGKGELGNLTLAAENARGQWGWALLETVISDFRYAIRVLSRRPGFTAVALLSLGLGIGANAAIFSLMDAMLLRALPVREPDRLVSFGISANSYYSFQQFKANSGHVLAGMAATTGPAARDLDTGDGPQRSYVELVSGDYFPLLGIAPGMGRAITTNDDRRGNTARVAVISYKYWQRAFAGAPILGRTIRVQNAVFSIIGVAPREFFGVTVGAAPDVWLPLTAIDDVFPGIDTLDNPSANWFSLIGRLRPGVSIQQASAALTPLAVRIDLDRAGLGLASWLRSRIEQQKLELTPAAQSLSVLRRRFSKPLGIVFAMVAIGFVLACVNLLSLQLARTGERLREISVRRAIGAGRLRIVRQLLTEALVLAAAGGILGLAICRPIAIGLISLISQGASPVSLDLPVNHTLLGFILTLTLAAALFCGVAPALRATKTDPAPSLQHGARATTAAPSRRALSRAITVVQFTISVVLVASAFLFAFSLYRLTHFDTGVDRRNLVVIDVDARDAGYQGQELARLHRRLLDRLSAVPGVASASLSGVGIYTGRNSNSQVGVDGFEAPEGPARNAFYDQIGPRYFATIGARLIAGREFDDHDNRNAERVAIVSESFARHFFAGRDPMGRRIRIGKPEFSFRVVGVVRDIWTNVRQEPLRYFYVPALQFEGFFFSTRFLVRTSYAPESAIPSLRAAVRQEASGLRIAGIDLADALLNRTLDLDRLIAALAMGFGVLALTLAAVGVYGRLAYEVVRRTGEIGIRMALGASRYGVMRLVLDEVAGIAAVGIAVGAAAALGLGRLAASLVFQVEPADPLVLCAAAGILFAAALAAAWLPAWRAARMHPMTALRHE